jgi:hypothetical protein
MGYRIRQIAPETKFNELTNIETITHVVPMETIHSGLRECGAQEQRERRLPGWLTVLFCIGLTQVACEWQVNAIERACNHRASLV